MSKKTQHFIVYSFQSLKDPLFEGLMLEYLKRLNLSTDVVFHLITHEQKSYRLSQEEKNKEAQVLRKFNIEWYPINYHTGKFILFKKTYDFSRSLLLCLKIKLKFKPERIIAFLSGGGAFSYIISKIINLKFIVVCLEPHSDYLVDFAIWSKGSLKYKLLNYFERKQAIYAEHIIVPTSYTLDLLKEYKSKAKVWLCPICVDENTFQFSQEHRDKLRNRYNIEEKYVLLYVGKFGGIYYSVEDVFDFFKLLKAQLPHLHLFVITGEKSDVLTSTMKAKNLNESDCTIKGFVPYSQLNEYISLADIGFLAVPSFPSQKYRTPVKTGIYLQTGLPYIVNEGIAEDDIVARKEDVGIVIKNISEESISHCVEGISRFSTLNKDELRERCRSAGIKYRSMNNMVSVLTNILKEITNSN
ncbi:MAG: glycosyltransferase [Flavobacteriales bacterium]